MQGKDSDLRFVDVWMKYLVHESFEKNDREDRDDDDDDRCVAWGLKKAQVEMNFLGSPGLLPIDGDLKGYLSGRSTRTFHTPPSYGAGCEQRSAAQDYR